jgi:hypothetical protein
MRCTNSGLPRRCRGKVHSHRIENVGFWYTVSGLMAAARPGLSGAITVTIVRASSAGTMSPAAHFIANL